MISHVKFVSAAASATFETLLKRYQPKVGTIAVAARRLIRSLMPKIEEQADAAAGIIGYGYGPGYRGSVCTLILSKKGVKVGLVRGAELDDPHGLLAGSGKVHRYIQLSSPADVRQPGVRDLIAATYDAWQERTRT